MAYIRGNFFGSIKDTRQERKVWRKLIDIRVYDESRQKTMETAYYVSSVNNVTDFAS